MFDMSRLRRTTWIDAQSLAEELYGIFVSASEEGIKGPVKINTTGDEPALIFNMPDADLEETAPIQINPQDPQPWEIPAFPGAPPLIPVPDVPDFPGFTPPPTPPSPGGGGGALPNPSETPGSTIPDPQEEAPFQTPITVLGRVVSGTGSSYVVDIYMNNPGDGVSYLRLTATVLQIASGDTVPANTPVYVTLYYSEDLNGGVRAYFQPPVWAD